MLRLVVPVPGGRPAALPEPERLALGWAMEHPFFALRPVEVSELAEVPGEVVWWHAARRGEPDPALVEALRARLKAGTPLLLTALALKALPLLGLEEQAPRCVEGLPWAGGEGERELRGHATYAGHPAFAAFGTGAYTWSPAAGVPVWDAWYHRDGDRPKGRPVAVERRYIGFDPAVVTALSYEPEGTRVGAVGAWLPFHDRRNPYRGHLERLIEGWLLWLAGHDPAEAPGAFIYAGLPHERRERPWPVPLPGAGHGSAPPDPAWLEEGEGEACEPVAAGCVERVWSRPAPDGWGQEREAVEDFFLDHAGGRHFLLAGARRGLDEAWTGGVRLWREVRSFWEGEGAPPEALDGPGASGRVEVVVRPDGLRRRITTPGGVGVRLVAAAHPDAPGGLALLEVTAPGPGTLRIEVTADLRLMWPYPAGLLAPLQSAGPTPGVVCLQGQDRSVTGALLLAGPAGAGTWTVADEPATDPEGEEVRSAVRLTGRIGLETGRGEVLLAWSVDRRGPAPAARALYRIARERGEIFERLRLLAGRRSRSRLRLLTPGVPLGADFEQVADGLEPFHLTVEGLGTSELAGFAPTGPGWLAGRPGYAWFFGRDGVVTALAQLALGRFEAAREVLAFLAAHQEWTGKILHEATLSGAVHYDAADATPWWLVLLGAWYRTTGDRVGLEAFWPAARRALAFCRRTDRDGDGLIENTGVGHGWIEGGPLAGAHVSFYLAGVWGAALEAAAECARALGEVEETERCRSEAARVRRVREELFWIEGRAGGTGHYALGLLRDRTLQEDLTILPAVPILLGQTDPERGRAHLVPLAGEAFTTDWGVRLVGRDHPHFHPSGYHYGSVWPLFTGWTAQAEYRLHRHEVALAHLQATLAGVRDPSPGCLEEALDGLTYRATGVCPHQAWSHAAVLQAVVEGLLGWQPDARPGGVSRLAPHVPQEWGRLTASGLRVGERRLELDLEEGAEGRVWTLRLTGEGELPLRFEPALPPEARLEGVRVDGGHLRARTTGGRDDQHLELDLLLAAGREVRVEVRYSYDLALLLPSPQLRPGACSNSWRLLDRWWEPDPRAAEACRLIVEGPAGGTGVIDLLLPGRRPTELEGARWAEPPRRGRGRLIVPFPATGDGRCDYTAVALRISFS